MSFGLGSGLELMYIAVLADASGSSTSIELLLSSSDKSLVTPKHSYSESGSLSETSRISEIFRFKFPVKDVGSFAGGTWVNGALGSPVPSDLSKSST